MFGYDGMKFIVFKVRKYIEVWYLNKTTETVQEYQGAHVCVSVVQCVFTLFLSVPVGG